MQENITQTIVLIGFGLIGKERLKAIESLKKKGLPISCVGIFDPFSAEAKKNCSELNITLFTSLEEVITAKPNWAIIAIPHQDIFMTVMPLLTANIKVLVEKPLGITLEEARTLHASALPNQLYVGFNYRFLDGIQQLYRDIQEDFFGEIISINMVLGHGGRPGDETTWKLDPYKSGGGALLDPGIHFLDLCLKFSKTPLSPASVVLWQGFWKTGIEEECRVLLSNDKSIFSLDVSVVRWRSTFRIEVHGTDGYGIVTGRNRSYGNQTYVRGKRWGWKTAESQLASEETLAHSSCEDVFEKELRNLFYPEEKTSMPVASSKEALAAMELWKKCLAISVSLNKTTDPHPANY